MTTVLSQGTISRCEDGCLTSALAASGLTGLAAHAHVPSVATTAQSKPSFPKATRMRTPN